MYTTVVEFILHTFCCIQMDLCYLINTTHKQMFYVTNMKITLYVCKYIHTYVKITIIYLSKIKAFSTPVFRVLNDVNLGRLNV